MTGTFAQPVGQSYSGLTAIKIKYPRAVEPDQVHTCEFMVQFSSFIQKNPEQQTVEVILIMTNWHFGGLLVCHWCTNWIAGHCPWALFTGPLWHQQPSNRCHHSCCHVEWLFVLLGVRTCDPSCHTQDKACSAYTQHSISVVSVLAGSPNVAALVALLLCGCRAAVIGTCLQTISRTRSDIITIFGSMIV